MSNCINKPNYNPRNDILAIRNDKSIEDLLNEPSFNRTIDLLRYPQRLADLLRFGADILYYWDTSERIT